MFYWYAILDIEGERISWAGRSNNCFLGRPGKGISVFWSQKQGSFRLGTNYTLLFQELFWDEFYTNWNCCFFANFSSDDSFTQFIFFSGWFLRNIFNWTRPKSVGNRQCKTLDLISLKRNKFHWINHSILKKNLLFVYLKYSVYNYRVIRLWRLINSLAAISCFSNCSN
jgi:hypothetical protein